MGLKTEFRIRTLVRKELVSQPGQVDFKPEIRTLEPITLTVQGVNGLKDTILVLNHMKDKILGIGIILGQHQDFKNHQDFK